MLLKKGLYLLILLAILLVSGYYYLLSRKSGNGSNKKVQYQLVNDWPKLPAGDTLGNPTGIGIDKDQNIFILHRAARKWNSASMPGTFISSETVLMLDRHSGKILNSWGANMFIMPHGLTIDDSNNVWLTDVGLHQVFKFSHEGKLLIKLGIPGVPGNDSLHFNLPTDVAVAHDGSFYVSDGYENSRVVKFSPTGKYLLQWGTRGEGAGQFNIPHGIALDERENVYVADRENSRIQVFNSSGKFLRQWHDTSFGHICSITFNKETRKMIAVDDVKLLFGHRGSDVIVFDSAGVVQTRFGRSGSYNGPTCWYHDVVTDNEGSIYVGDILGNRIQKFKKVKSCAE